MDQIKIGRFIQEKRKEKNLTQSDLAEKLNITDRSISKWENGICMPDVGIMSDLCNILNISINDLFSGEIVDMKDNEKKLEENLLEMAKLKEQKDKELLKLEFVIGYTASIAFLTLLFVASYIEMQTWVRIVLLVIAFVSFIVGVGYALRIEQVAGYYECQNCHHKYVPTYKSVLWSQHINRSRKMRCPNCHQKNWHKKVLK